MKIAPVTVTLNQAVEHDGKTYDTLTFNEPTVVDMVTADRVDGEMAKVVATLACMSGVPLPVIHKIKVSDLNRIIPAVAQLMGESAMAAGLTSSH